MHYKYLFIFNIEIHRMESKNQFVQWQYGVRNKDYWQTLQIHGIGKTNPWIEKILLIVYEKKPIVFGVRKDSFTTAKGQLF